MAIGSAIQKRKTAIGFRITQVNATFVCSSGRVMKRLTDERFASIPAMIEQGFSKAEIAAMWGVTISTLQVQCSRRGISLSKGGHLLPR